MERFYTQNRVGFYPLYLREKKNCNHPYCSFAVKFVDGTLEIEKDPFGREEIVMNHNRLLEEGSPKAYQFLKENLKKIESQTHQ